MWGDHRPFDRPPSVLRLRSARSLRRLEESINLNAEPLGICLVALAGEGSGSDERAGEVGFDPVAMRLKFSSLEEMSRIQFPDDLIEFLPEHQLTVAPDEGPLYIEERVSPVEEADDKEEGMGEQQDAVAEAVWVPKADHLLSADLHWKSLHRPELRTVHAMSPVLLS